MSITKSNVEFLTKRNHVQLSRIAVIHNGVNVAELDRAVPARVRSELGLEDSTFLFAVVGSLVERKGHRYLLEAFSRLGASERTRTALLIAGEGEDEGYLKKMCSELGLTGRVFFVGQRNDAQGVMLDIDCLVVPSTMEGMPYVVLEAMAASKPVIASKIYGIPEVIVDGETGILVSPCDVDALQAAMLRAFEDPVSSRRMGTAGRRKIESHFSAERTAREVEQVYKSILSGEPVSTQ